MCRQTQKRSRNLKKLYRDEIKLAGSDFDSIFPEAKIREIMEIPKIQKISYDDFEKALLEICSTYLHAKNSRQSLATTIVDAPAFSKIAGSLSSAVGEINNLKVEQIKRLYSEYRFWAGSKNLQIEYEGIIGIDRGEAEQVVSKRAVTFRSALRAIKTVQRASAQLAWAGTADFSDDMPLKPGHRPKNDHLHSLIDKVQKLWTKASGTEFTRNFHRDPKTEKLEALTPASMFALRIAQAIDPELEPKHINSAMKTTSQARLNK
ncbi:hypothetical protein [Aestuariivirga sp.]|uniref:hypothetical protein n=1 Tax=Aestuariivirga sp. TaxID=2650926 RepID=UPI0039E3C12B